MPLISKYNRLLWIHVILWLAFRDSFSYFAPSLLIDTRHTNPLTPMHSTISLFSRQKKRSRGVIFATMVLCLGLHLVQFLALANYNRLKTTVTVDDWGNLVEQGLISSTIPAIEFAAPGNASTNIRELVQGSEFSSRDAPLLGFCVTATGQSFVGTNIVIGIGFVYLFIFQDLWRVIFSTTVTRSFPPGTVGIKENEPNWQIMIFGVLLLVIVNAAIQAWLGVEAGFSVIASGGSFRDILFNSLSIFIILKLDDVSLPLVRYLIEDWGSVDQYGNLDKERLDLLTHGSQYYKPGYGIHWGSHLMSGSILLRIISFCCLLLAFAFLAIPFGFTLDDAIVSFKLC